MQVKYIDEDEKFEDEVFRLDEDSGGRSMRTWKRNRVANESWVRELRVDELES
jgi:hypothetical protein